MDFVKLLRSLEEFLYEAMTWLLFYPSTLWRVVRGPLKMMRYSDKEQGNPSEQQYTGAVSPPLFMMLSILLAHILELSVHQSITFREGFRSIFQTDQTFLLLRCVVYGLYPLAFASMLVRKLGIPLDRDSLRAPFFAQCYVTAPCALLSGLASIGLRMQDLAVVGVSLLLALGTLAWFLAVQTRWFRERTGMSLFRALRLAVWLWLVATVIAAMVFTILVV
jgi:hypothetical protein